MRRCPHGGAAHAQQETIKATIERQAGNHSQASGRSKVQRRPCRRQPRRHGTALGLLFALILVSTPFFGVLPLIRLSDNPDMTMATLVGTAALMFGVGAALTGFILMMEDVEHRR